MYTIAPYYTGQFQDTKRNVQFSLVYVNTQTTSNLGLFRAYLYISPDSIYDHEILYRFQVDIYRFQVDIDLQISRGLISMTLFAMAGERRQNFDATVNKFMSTRHGIGPNSNGTFEENQKL